MMLMWYYIMNHDYSDWSYADIDDTISELGDTIEEQVRLLRECRYALEDLIDKKKGIEGLVCGSNTLGNLKAEFFHYRRIVE